MKKFVAVLAVLLLILPAIAVADEGDPVLVKANYISLNEQTNTFICRLESNSYYILVDPSGEILVDESAGYTEMNIRGKFFLVEKKVPDGIHRKGLIDGRGKVLVPAEYADINVISPRWQAGIKLVPSTADDKDYTYTNYSTDEKSFYKIDTVDFYFDGVKVGTLNRYDYGEGSIYTRGAYISVVNKAKERIHYDLNLQKSPYVQQSASSSEFESVNVKGKYNYFHRATGQQVFVESCTLNPADLEDPYLYDRVNLYDIQGKILFAVPKAYDSLDQFYGGYALVRFNGKRGLISIDGREVIPPEYDSVGYYEDAPLQYGCISAVKDGKFGFLDAQGNVTCDFVYPENIVSNRVTFATLKNLDGTIIVLSGIVGELPEHFSEVRTNSRGAAAFVAKNEDGESCVIDLSGKVLVPYGNYRDLEVSDDASVVIGYYGSQQYEIYRFAPYTPENKPASANNTPAAAADDATGWTCSQGHTGNQGNFCSECGEPKPVETPADAGWTCENGHTGNQGKFCTECGAPKPEEAAPLTHCPNCDYDFGGTVPKFCPSCGTPTGVK